MSSITFDKLAYIDTLKASGVDEEQARAQAMALDVTLKDTVATKADLVPIETRLSVVESQLSMLQWMIGGIGFGVLLLVLRSFWGS